MTVQPVILVGVDGSKAGWSALEWAATEADATGRRLLVVHAGDIRPVEGTVDPLPFGRKLLDEAVATLAATHPRVAVNTELVSCDPADAILDLAEDADIVAVGRGRRGLPGLLLGTVAFRVLARCQKPTAVVAAGARAHANQIVVGVSDSAGGAAALRFAFEEAERRGSEVVAVRSWSERDWRLAAGAALPLTTPESWEAQERTVLDDCLRPFRSTFPAVAIRTILSGTPSEIVLEQASEDAAMLVLGCRRSDDSRLPRLGPIASWAAHHYRCPVVVVGHLGRAAEPVLDGDLARATADAGA
jgi:nucleotide-binding universal stress UspA family protein